MDPDKIRAAFGLPPDATDDDLYAAMAHDPDPEVPAVRDAYSAWRAREPTPNPWMVLASQEVSRAALELLELWIMARSDRTDVEATKILCMDALGPMTKIDVARVATAVAALAVHVLTTDQQRAAVSERLALEIMLLMETPERS